jgi:hypothetical protein
MNQRVSLTAIATRLRAQISSGLGVAKIGSALDADYLRTVGDSTYWPAVWVGAQRSTPINDGRGYSQRVRQDVAVEFVVRVICKRYIAGEQDEEDKLNNIGDAVANALMGWQPSNAVKPCTWVQSIDGPPEDSVMVLDLLFQTQTTYQYPITS